MASQLALRYDHNTKPSNLVTSIFMSTLNTAARMLVSVAQSTGTGSGERWKAMDHVKYMFMLATWMTVWVFRIVMDYFPLPVWPPASSSPYLLDGFSALYDLSPFSSSSTMYPLFLSSGVSSLDMLLPEGADMLPVQALGGALSQVLSLINDLPATSRKYQFALTMADNIIDGNIKDGYVEVMQLNRVVLASAFARTSSLLYGSIQSCSQADNFPGSWASRVVSLFPLGSYFLNSLRLVLPFTSSAGSSQKQIALIGSTCDSHVVAEKHAQELLWLTNKMRLCGVVDEALVQWSFASSLASVALTANARVQGFIVKISAILLGEMIRSNIEVAKEVKFRLLAIWVPIFCYAENGVAYPTLTGYEKAEMERVINQLISTLPVADQQIILTNWLQDFLISTSDWPNLQSSYDRWCHTTRKLIE